MTVCFECKHFKQTGPLEFSVSGYCGWRSSTGLPHWLNWYVDTTDNYYGPKRQVGKRYSGYEVKSCDAFELADDSVIEKRKSETWYD